MAGAAGVWASQANFNSLNKKKKKNLKKKANCKEVHLLPIRTIVSILTSQAAADTHGCVTRLGLQEGGGGSVEKKRRETESATRNSLGRLSEVRTRNIHLPGIPEPLQTEK